MIWRQWKTSLYHSWFQNQMPKIKAIERRNTLQLKVKTLSIKWLIIPRISHQMMMGIMRKDLRIKIGMAQFWIRYFIQVIREKISLYRVIWIKKILFSLIQFIILNLNWTLSLYWTVPKSQKQRKRGSLSTKKKFQGGHKTVK